MKIFFIRTVEFLKYALAKLVEIKAQFVDLRSKFSTQVTSMIF